MADLPVYTDPDPSLAELLATHPQLSTDPLCGLMFEGVALNAIADAMGTPCWVVGANTLRQRLRRMQTAMTDAGLDVHIHYAVKANSHLSILSIIGQEGYGADIVSGGELARTQKAGIPAQRVVFSGVGKSDAELEYAIALGIGQINVESAEELHIVSAIATRLGKQARITLRVNPDVDAKTHAKITTGLADNKFGIPFDNAAALYARAFTLPGLKPVGFATHIGSQILSTAPYRAAYARIAELVRSVRASGLAVEVVDCGGGLGISYRNEVEGQPEALANAIRAELGGLDLQLSIEPGRWPIGPAGVLLSSVVLRKEEGLPSPFLVLDAAMNDLVRPSMYEAWHGILPLAPQDFHQPVTPIHVVGPVCESGDTFARNRLLPPLGRASRIAILDTGAYGTVMSSNYNSRPLASEVLVENGQWTVIRHRQTLEEMWEDETPPAPPTGKA